MSGGGLGSPFCFALAWASAGEASAITIAADKQGNIYVIHRPMDAGGDPIVVLDRNGTFLRSWGKGDYKIPHGIRIDSAGNIWTLDANLSKVFKYTPDGKKLMTIDVGGVPDPSRDFCGITDIAFNPQVYRHIANFLAAPESYNRKRRGAA